MKALRIIQILSKIARVISFICFILSIVGVAGCVVGLILLPLLKDVVINNNQTLEMMLLEKGVNITTAMTSMSIGVVGCGASIYLSKISELFFKKEIALGTPFKLEIVKDMRKLALIHISTSLILIIAIAIALAIVKACRPELGNLNSFYAGSSIGFGITLLIISLFAEYGAEKDDKVIDQPVEEKNKEE